MIQCQIDIRQSLCLNALCRIHHQDRAVAGRQRTADFVVKVHMSRSIDQVKDILFSVLRLIYRAYCLCLDGDATLSLQIHIIQNLCLHFSAGQQTGLLNNTVCQSGFSMIYMCHNTKIADLALIYRCHTAVLS